MNNIRTVAHRTAGLMSTVAAAALSSGLTSIANCLREVPPHCRARKKAAHRAGSYSRILREPCLLEETLLGDHRGWE